MDKTIDFLKRNNWTTDDLTDQKWAKDRWGCHVYGKITDSNLRNTNGVAIYPGGVLIAYFNEDGVWTKPYIYCYEGELEIKE